MTKRQLEDIAPWMDDDIRERVHAELAPCDPDRFLSRYLELDPKFPIGQFDKNGAPR